MTRRLLWLLAGALAFGLGTLAFGWWSVPVLGLVMTRLMPGRDRPLVLVPLAALLGWALLLLRAAVFGRLLVLQEQLAALLGLPAPALVAATLLFPALLAFGAALIAGAGRRPIPRHP